MNRQGEPAPLPARPLSAEIHSATEIAAQRSGFGHRPTPLAQIAISVLDRPRREPASQEPELFHRMEGHGAIGLAD